MKRNHLTFMVAALMLAGLFSVAQEPASAHERCWNNSGNQNARAYRKRIKHHKKAWRNQANNRPASVNPYYAQSVSYPYSNNANYPNYLPQAQNTGVFNNLLRYF